jgi:glycosyltransferase involved in cell wall biosynthesis
MIVVRYRKANVIYLVAGPCQLAAVYLGLLTRKQIVLDIGWPLSDAIQKKTRRIAEFWTQMKNLTVDYTAMHISNLTICESIEQKKNMIDKFRMKEKKLYVGYTGINETGFHELAESPHELKNMDKSSRFILFRGKINPDAGILDIIELIKRCPNLNFLICSPLAPSKLKDFPNVVLIERTISPAEMRYVYSVSSLALGQFGDFERMKRTIPHKAFEAAFFGVPYFCFDSPALRELFPDSDHAFLISRVSIREVSIELQQSIKNFQLLIKVGKNSQANYQKYFNQELTAKNRLCAIRNRI